MTKPFKTLDDMGDIAGKRVLVREDLNVPMQDGAVTDDTRLRAAMPTVLELADRGAKVLILAHFGRPKGPEEPRIFAQQDHAPADPALSMIPTTTGAARAVGEVLPELKGKLDGSSVRVPTPNVSVVDLKFIAKRETSKDEVNQLLKAASEDGPLKGVLGYSDEPLVSIDYNGDPRSSTVDSLETAVIDGSLVRVLSWYDNEWGFSNRMIDTTGVMAKFL